MALGFAGAGRRHRRPHPSGCSAAAACGHGVDRVLGGRADLQMQAGLPRSRGVQPTKLALSQFGSLPLDVFGRHLRSSVVGSGAGGPRRQPRVQRSAGLLGTCDRGGASLSRSTVAGHPYQTRNVGRTRRTGGGGHRRDHDQAVVIRTARRSYAGPWRTWCLREADPPAVLVGNSCWRSGRCRSPRLRPPDRRCGRCRSLHPRACGRPCPDPRPDPARPSAEHVHRAAARGLSVVASTADGAATTAS